jgi:hypothetical protein
MKTREYKLNDLGVNESTYMEYAKRSSNAEDFIERLLNKGCMNRVGINAYKELLIEKYKEII